MMKLTYPEKAGAIVTFLIIFCSRCLIRKEKEKVSRIKLEFC